MIQGGYRKVSVGFSKSVVRSRGFTISATQQWCPRIAAARQRPGFARLGLHQAGFTIVEVMIVTAVTGVMLIAAATFLNGRQNRTQFTVGVNALQQQLQQIINETASGFYPNNGSAFSCSGASSPVTLSTLTTNKQGTNGGCIFVGKALQIGTGPSGSAASTLLAIPLVGNQYQPSSFTSVLTVTQARPRAVYQAGPPVIDGSTPTSIQNSMTVATSNSFCGGGLGGMCYVTNPVPPAVPVKVATGIVAFLAGDSSGNIASMDGSGNLQAGAQPLSLYGVTSATTNEPIATAATAIGTTSNLVQASSVSICMADSGTKQSGLYTIDAGLHVSLVIKSGLTC